MPNMSTDEAKPTFRQRLSTMGAAFKATREADSRFLPLVLGIPMAVLAVCVLVGALTGALWIGVGAGVMLALSAALIVFGRLASATQLRAIEGQPGAAAAVLQTMRGAWIVTPAAAFTRKQDFVHRVVGRPGVVLVGEGSPARVAQMLKQEHRKVARAAGEVPVHEVSVGNREGQVPLSKLHTHVARLPRSMKARQVGPLDTRLAALGSQDMPLPKGPLPHMKKRR